MVEGCRVFRPPFPSRGFFVRMNPTRREPESGWPVWPARIRSSDFVGRRFISAQPPESAFFSEPEPQSRHRCGSRAVSD